MKYKILYSHASSHNGFLCNTVEDLEKKVNASITSGWKPLGGPAVTFEKFGNSLNDPYIFQAMIKED